MNAARERTGLIYDTDTARFVDEVIERSRANAVAVDFWAPWCGPCRALAPILEALVEHYGGRLAVARVNIDTEPALASQFGIRSIPDVRIFRNGKMVDGFVGVQPLARLLPIFDKHVARASEGLRTQAQERLRSGDVPGAVALLRQLLAEDPNNAAATVDLADALARLGEIGEAEKLLEELPANESGAREVAALTARLHFMRHAAGPEEVESLRAAASGDKASLDDMHRLAAYEILHGDTQRGLELLFSIMQRDRRFGDDLARRSLLQAFELLGENDERVVRIRRRMAALLH